MKLGGACTRFSAICSFAVNDWTMRIDVLAIKWKVCILADEPHDAFAYLDAVNVEYAMVLLSPASGLCETESANLRDIYQGSLSDLPDDCCLTVFRNRSIRDIGRVSSLAPCYSPESRLDSWGFSFWVTSSPAGHDIQSHVSTHKVMSL